MSAEMFGRILLGSLKQSAPERVAAMQADGTLQAFLERHGQEADKKMQYLLVEEGTDYPVARELVIAEMLEDANPPEILDDQEEQDENLVEAGELWLESLG